jgi:putative flavoprotein involved in K+ transport
MTVPTRTETVVVGAGQAGLATSRYLSRAGRDHVVLEARRTLGGGWQDRWDSFRVVSPNWFAGQPGMPYDGDDPDGFMPRDEIAARIAHYAAVSGAPVVTEAQVEHVAARAGGGFTVRTAQGTIEADRVIVATGAFHRPRRSPIAAALPARLFQLHVADYHREADLPPGGVLVIGSGQSGVQLAEELFAAGRAVFLSVGSAGRFPRRYRGSDVFRWLALLARDGERLGFPLPTVDRLPAPGAKFAGNPHVSGYGGGHDTNLREFAARGMTLLGRIEDVDGEQVRLAADLPTNLAWADRFFDERFKPLCDGAIGAAGIDAPPDDRVPFAYDPPALETLDLERAGITSVLWTSGFRMDYGWIDLPVLDADGYPRHRRGLTDYPELAFVGLLWQHNQASATLCGTGIEARHVVRALGIPVEDEEPGPKGSATA